MTSPPAMCSKILGQWDFSADGATQYENIISAPNMPLLLAVWASPVSGKAPVSGPPGCYQWWPLQSVWAANPAGSDDKGLVETFPGSDEPEKLKEKQVNDVATCVKQMRRCKRVGLTMALSWELLACAMPRMLVVCMTSTEKLGSQLAMRDPEGERAEIYTFIRWFHYQKPIWFRGVLKSSMIW